jgi:subtilisin family serine protease
MPAAAGGAGGDPEKIVLVELRVPAEEAPFLAGEAATQDAATQLAVQLAVPGFSVDEEYPPVPVPATDTTATLLAAAGERAMLVRGRVQQSRMAELRAQPNVLAVWDDTPIAPFTELAVGGAPEPAVSLEPASVTPVEVGALVTARPGLGVCPVQPCDCQPGTAKGDIPAVAAYLGVTKLWAQGVTGGGVVIGIVDGGITAVGRNPKPGETAQIPRVIDGYPADWGTTAIAWSNHGNMTSTDALGMAPQSQLYDIRISAGGIQATISAAIAGYDWAIQRHRTDGTPHILSNSWGIYQKSWDQVYATDPNHPFTRKVVEALDEGILVLFAAGNCGEGCADGRCGGDIGPGKSIWGANGHPRVLTVAAVNVNGDYVGYSSEGPAALDPRKPDFCSVSHFRGYFASDTGTSAATPVAAGVVALLRQGNSGLTQDQAKQAILTTARDLGPAGWDQFTGPGC